MNWVAGLRPVVLLCDLGLYGSALCGSISKASKPVFTRVSEKTTENFERFGRQVRPGIEPGISRQPVLSAEPLHYWWDKDV